MNIEIIKKDENTEFIKEEIFTARKELFELKTSITEEINKLKSVDNIRYNKINYDVFSKISSLIEKINSLNEKYDTKIVNDEKVKRSFDKKIFKVNEEYRDALQEQEKHLLNIIDLLGIDSGKKFSSITEQLTEKNQEMLDYVSQLNIEYNKALNESLKKINDNLSEQIIQTNNDVVDISETFNKELEKVTQVTQKISKEIFETTEKLKSELTATSIKLKEDQENVYAKLTQNYIDSIKESSDKLNSDITTKLQEKIDSEVFDKFMDNYTKALKKTDKNIKEIKESFSKISSNIIDKLSLTEEASLNSTQIQELILQLMETKFNKKLDKIIVEKVDPKNLEIAKLKEDIKVINSEIKIINEDVEQYLKTEIKNISKELNGKITDISKKLKEVEQNIVTPEYIKQYFEENKEQFMGKSPDHMVQNGWLFFKQSDGEWGTPIKVKSSVEDTKRESNNQQPYVSIIGGGGGGSNMSNYYLTKLFDVDSTNYDVNGNILSFDQTNFKFIYKINDTGTTNTDLWTSNKIIDYTGSVVGNYQLLSEKNQTNGYPGLINGKIDPSQLPDSVIEYKGTWNALTNTPTLIDGTGNTGDFYVTSVEGSQTFDGELIEFKVGDWVMYNGTVWQKSQNQDLSGFIPYTGANKDVDLGTNKLTANDIETKYIDLDSAYDTYEHGNAPAGQLDYYNIRNINHTAGVTGTLPSITAEEVGGVKTGNMILSAGTYNVYSDINGALPLLRYEIAEQTLTLVANSINYIVFDGNTESVEVYQTREAPHLIDQLKIIPIYTIYRMDMDGEISFFEVNWDLASQGLANKIADGLVRTERWTAESGMELSASNDADRKIILSEGYIWRGRVHRYFVDSFDSSVDTCYIWYKIGTEWYREAATKYNNSQYNDVATGLAELPTWNDYAINWVYRAVLTDGTKHACILLGNTPYKFTNVMEIPAPDVSELPPPFQSLGMLAGRIIVRKGNNTTIVTSAFNNTSFDFIDENTINRLDDADRTLVTNGVKNGMKLDIATLAPTTKFKITAGSYYSLEDGVTQFAELDEIPLTNLTTQLVTYIALDYSQPIGLTQIVQSSSPFTPTDRRNYILIGAVIHSNMTTINAFNSMPDVAKNVAGQYNDLLDAIRVFNVNGNIISANGVNKYLNKSSGEIFKKGVNFHELNGSDNPNLKFLDSLSAPATLRHRTRSITLLTPEGLDTNTLDVGYYDRNGVKTAITAPYEFSIMRVALFSSNLIRIQYGQAVYKNMADALAAVNTEVFAVEQNIAENGLFRGVIVVSKNATDLSNPLQAKFIELNRFGEVNQSIGGIGGTTTLQQAYNNSPVGEIVTDATRDGVTFQNGQVGGDALDVFQVNNYAGETVFNVNGEGNVKAQSANIDHPTADNIIKFGDVGDGSVPLWLLGEDKDDEGRNWFKLERYNEFEDGYYMWRCNSDYLTQIWDLEVESSIIAKENIRGNKVDEGFQCNLMGVSSIGKWVRIATCPNSSSTSHAMFEIRYGGDWLNTIPAPPDGYCRQNGSLIFTVTSDIGNKSGVSIHILHSTSMEGYQYSQIEKLRVVTKDAINQENPNDNCESYLEYFTGIYDEHRLYIHKHLSEGWDILETPLVDQAIPAGYSAYEVSTEYTFAIKGYDSLVSIDRDGNVETDKKITSNGLIVNDSILGFDDYYSAHLKGNIFIGEEGALPTPKYIESVGGISLWDAYLYGSGTMYNEIYLDPFQDNQLFISSTDKDINIQFNSNGSISLFADLETTNSKISMNSVNVISATLSGKNPTINSLDYGYYVDKAGVIVKTTHNFIGDVTINATDDTDLGGDNLQENGLFLDGAVDTDKQIVFKDNGVDKWAIQGAWRNEDARFMYFYNLDSQENPLVISRNGRFGFNRPISLVSPYVAYNGTGLNDVTASGNFEGNTTTAFRIYIDSVGTPDTFRWEYLINAGGTGSTWTSGGTLIPCQITPYELREGVYITFGATTGHSLTDTWSVRGFSQDPPSTMDIKPPMIHRVMVSEDAGSTFIDYTYKSATTQCSIADSFEILGDTDHYLYLGNASKWSAVNVILSQYGVGGTFKVQYLNSSDAWVDVPNAIDSTTNLTANGDIIWDNTEFVDWAKKTIDGTEGYWLRLIPVTAYSTPAELSSICRHTNTRLAVYSAHNDLRPAFQVEGDGVTKMWEAERVSTATSYRNAEYITEQRLKNALSVYQDRIAYLTNTDSGINKLLSLTAQASFSNTYSVSQDTQTELETWIEFEDAMNYRTSIEIGDRFESYLYLQKTTANRGVTFQVDLLVLDSVGTILHTYSSAEIVAPLATNIEAYTFVVTADVQHTFVAGDKLAIRVKAKRSGSPLTTQNVLIHGGGTYNSQLDYPAVNITLDRLFEHFEEDQDTLKNQWKAKGIGTDYDIELVPKGAGIVRTTSDLTVVGDITLESGDKIINAVAGTIDAGTSDIETTGDIEATEFRMGTNAVMKFNSVSNSIDFIIN